MFTVNNEVFTVDIIVTNIPFDTTSVALKDPVALNVMVQHKTG